MAFVTTYKPLEIAFTKGEGITLYDQHGDAYLDALSGIAVCNLGHCHPAITKTICQQAETLLHTSNVYQIIKQQQLAEKLTLLTEMQQIFFANSGAEANETAIKLARLYGHKQGIKNPTIIVMENAFHGRTMATLTACGSRKAHAGFEPLVPGFVRAPYNDIKAVQTITEHNEEVVAIMLEPIQGEGGIRVPAPDYLTQLRKICDERNLLMILDEVQTGVGRTGQLYAYQHTSILPDIVTTAKGLANGIPIGICLMRDKSCDLFHPGQHGSTFGGNPLSCAVALKVLEIIEENDYCANAKKIGAYLLEQLKQKLQHHPLVVDIRGQGLMIGVELSRPCQELMNFGLKQRLLFNVTSESVIRLLPPLITQQSDADLIVSRLKQAIDAFHAAGV